MGLVLIKMAPDSTKRGVQMGESVGGPWFLGGGGGRGGGGSPGGDSIPSLPGCVCPKVMDMGPFWASSE